MALSNIAALRPSLEFGVRHDGDDAETRTGVELGSGVSHTDTVSCLRIEAKALMLVAHADWRCEEWDASVTAQLGPGADGWGLSFSLSPVIGAASSAAERWGAQDARSLAPGGAQFEASRGLRVEAG